MIDYYNKGKIIIKTTLPSELQMLNLRESSSPDPPSQSTPGNCMNVTRLLFESTRF